MESRSRGALLSFVLLVLGSTLLPEPCDAWPRGYRPRHSRNAAPAPEPRCPNCARDCPQNLAGDSILAKLHKVSSVSEDVLKVIKTLYGIGKSLLGSEINEDYQPLSAAQYPPVPQPSYETVSAAPAYSPPQILQAYNPAPAYVAPAAVAAYAAPLPAQTYSAPLPAQAYDPRLAPAPYNQPAQTLTPPAEPPCYNCPQVGPGNFNLLSKAPSRYPPWRRPLSKFPRSPYALQEYRQQLYPQEASAAAPGTEYDCECGCEPKYQVDPVHEADEDATSYGSYNRRSVEGEAHRVLRHYNPGQSSPSEMYKTYLPYVRDETPSEPAPEYASNENDPRAQERLYVVYRADAGNPDQQSTEDRPISERELEAVIRKAIEIARQQRTQDNVLRRRMNQQYQYESRPDAEVQRAQRQWPPAPAHTETNEGEAEDEIRNPGLDQNKWVAIPAVSAVPVITKSDAPPAEQQWKPKAGENNVKPPGSETLKPVSVDLLRDLESVKGNPESLASVPPAEASTNTKP